MKNVLVICIGNICRSPMAEGILRATLPEVNVASAGIGALIGQPADDAAKRLMSEINIDISSHIAQQINQLLCRQADLILVMDTTQRRYVERTYPFTRGRVFRIAEDSKIDVPDPYKKGPDAFEEALSLIQSGASTWIQRINKINEQERQLT